MRLYNTLSRKLDDVKPLDAPKVTVYTCGPTVYDYPHIGNWFTFLRYDLLVRTLKVAGFEPDWVMNITDVGHLVSDADEGEDKLEKGAKREGKTAWDVAKFYGDNFVEGIHKLNMLEPQHLPKATDHIEEQIDLIKRLEDKGYTYVIDDGVYFETAKFEGYGVLARLDIEQLMAGARVEYNRQKHSPTDFALWKFSPTIADDIAGDSADDSASTKNAATKRDMEWDSPWGVGFPGWHIECSAMSMKYLGETLDIHAGGIDHVPVHHTNEIAQSEAATGKPFSAIWVHTNHILINGDRIAKSAGNGITLEELGKSGYDPLDLRLLVLESHYRSQSMFSWETLSAARTRRHSFNAFAVMRFQPHEGAAPLGDRYFSIQSEAVKAALEDDLNTPTVLRIINETASQIDTSGLNPTHVEEFQSFLELLDDALGLRLLDTKDIPETLKETIRLREEARQNKDWAKSDTLRDDLIKAGFTVRDTPYGSVWSALTPSL